jgi:hypothetical protein
VRERLARVFARIGEASEGELEVVRLVVREVLLSSERFQRVFARMQRGHVKLLLEALGEGVQSGEIDASIPPPLLLLSTLAMGAMPQFVRRAAGHAPPFKALPPAPLLAEMSAELLLRAIGARKPRGAAALPSGKINRRRTAGR